MTATSLPQSERCALAAVIGRTGEPTAAQALWAQVEPEHGLALRLAAAEALHGMRARDAWSHVDGA